MKEKGRNRDRKKWCWAWEGSYTLEAAFIIPLILGIIFAWMFELFYFHDRVMLDGMMQQQLIKSVAVTQVSDTEEVKIKELQKEIQKKMWLLKITSLKEKNSFGKRKYQAKVEVKWGIPVMRDFLKGILDYQKEWNCYTIQPDYLLRFQE